MHMKNCSVELLPLPKRLIEQLEEMKYILTHRDVAMGKTVLSTWEMNSCRVHMLIKKEDEKEGNSCPIQ